MSTTVRGLAIAIALYAVVLAVALARYAPPPPAGSDAPAEKFSASRARELDARLVGDGATRFVGTPGNARGREIVVGELQRMGWTVDKQHAMSCTVYGMCAPIVNVVARLPGREPALPGVLLSAHYDSVPAGPGAADDGVGVAVVLETARALSAGPRPRRTVVALVTDGEESGLLGADAFVRGNALASSVRTTVNIDARGSGGPSMMFETGSGNAWVVAMMASYLERPVTTSLFNEVYKRMPNGTDFTMTKRISPDMTGVNFANTGGFEDYHTSHDTLAALDMGTLQHHGDHALGMTRAFAETDVGTRSDAALGADAVWFDVLAFGIVHWPASWSLPLALGALALVLLQTLRARAFGLGLAAFSVVLPGFAASTLVGWVLKAAGAFPAFWVASPGWALAALHAATLLGVFGAAFGLARRSTSAIPRSGAPPAFGGASTPRALWSGIWIVWSALGVATAIALPGASYLFVVPALLAGAASGLSFTVSCALPAVLAAVLLLGLSRGLYDSLGFVTPAAVTAATTLAVTALTPMVAGLPGKVAKWASLALGAAILVAGIGAVVAPKYTAARPERVNVVFRQDEDQARAFVDTSWGWASWGPPPPAMLDALGHVDGAQIALPWTLAAPFAKVPSIDAPPPAFEVLSTNEEGGTRRVRAKIRSPRGAPSMALVFPSNQGITVAVEGHTAFPQAVGASSVLGVVSVPAAGTLVELGLPKGTPKVGLTILDRSFGVPPGTKAEAAVRARPSDAVPVQDGDVTVFSRRVEL